MRRFSVLLVVLGFAAASMSAAPQQPAVSSPGPTVSAAPPATALILGRVVDANTGRPISDAVVSLSPGEMLPRDLGPLGLPQAPPIRRIVSDAAGRFVLRDLAAGQYRFNVTAAGYLSGAYGQQRAQGAAQSFVLAPSQKVGDVVIRLWKTATISGTVTDEAGEPVVGVRVNLLRRSRTDGKWLSSVYASARTDDRGMYRITGNLPSLYYVDVPATISSIPQSMAQAATTLAAVGMISVDVENAPGVLALARAGGGGAIQVGESLLQLTSPNSFALPPNVTADGRVFGYPTTFYPSALTSTRATAITLEVGEDRTGVDIQVRPVPLVRVSGSVIGPSGPERRLQVRLISAEVDVVGGGGSGIFETAETITDNDGLFSFAAVPPGQFTIKASRTNRPIPGAPEAAGGARRSPPQMLWAEMPLSISDSNIAGVALRMQEGTSVSGRVVFEGLVSGAPAPPVPEFSLSTADGHAMPCCPTTEVSASGVFSSQGYATGRYYPSVTNVAGWHLRSVTVGGRDVLRSPLVVGSEPIGDVVVTVMREESTIEGRVVTRAGAVDSDATVLVFPMEYQSMADGVNPRIVRLARPIPQTGSFSLPSVVPGEYLVAAVPDGDLPNWRDPNVIGALVQFATRVTVAPGERRVVTLVRGDLR